MIFQSFTEKKVLRFIQIVSERDNLNQMPTLFSVQERKKYFKMLPAFIYSQQIKV